MHYVQNLLKFHLFQNRPYLTFGYLSILYHLEILGVSMLLESVKFSVSPNFLGLAFPISSPNNYNFI